MYFDPLWRSISIAFFGRMVIFWRPVCFNYYSFPGSLWREIPQVPLRVARFLKEENSSTLSNPPVLDLNAIGYIKMDTRMCANGRRGTHHSHNRKPVGWTQVSHRFQVSFSPTALLENNMQQRGVRLQISAAWTRFEPLVLWLVDFTRGAGFNLHTNTDICLLRSDSSPWKPSSACIAFDWRVSIKPPIF